MVVVKWCKCLNLKLCLVNPPTPVADQKWIIDNTTIRKCGESKVQGNVVTMELDKMVQTRMVSGWQVWKCLNCNVDVCAIDIHNNVALVNMEMEDNDDLTQLKLDPNHVYSDCFGVVVDTSPPSDADNQMIPAERDPSSIEHFNRLQQHVDVYLSDAERAMEKRIRQFIKEQNEALNQLRSKVNNERTVIWRKMCTIANTAAAPLSSTPSAASTISSTPTTPTTTTAAAASTSASARARTGSVSRPHSRSVTGAVAPFAGTSVGAPVIPIGTSVSNDKPVLGSTFGTIAGFNVPGSTPPPKNNSPAIPYTPEPSVPPLPIELPEPITPPKPKTEPAKPESGTKWQAAPLPSAAPTSTTAAAPASSTKTNTPKISTTKRHMRRSSSPSIFSFDDEEDIDERPDTTLDDSSDDDVVVDYTPSVHPPKIPDSSNLLGSSLPVAIPARMMNPANHYRPPPVTTNTTTTTSTSTVVSTPKKGGSFISNANATGSPSTIAPTTVSMSSVSIVSSTAPTHQYHALRPQSHNVAPLSSSASNSNELMVPKQSWRENFLGEAAEESLPVEMASSFIVPLSLNRRLKSLI